MIIRVSKIFNEGTRYALGQSRDTAAAASDRDFGN
jgi:hypothetical protein